MKELLKRYPTLGVCAPQISAALQALLACYKAGGKLLICGNGGSCADAEHISGELLKGFLKKRPLSARQRQAMQAACPALDTEVLCKLQQGLPALPLPAFTALGTAFNNDVDPQLIFAQALLALGKPGDVLLCISTSGNAKNVLWAARVAKALGITVLGLTGADGGALGAEADLCICAPERETFLVQELHLPIYHYLCAAVEDAFFKE